MRSLGNSKPIMSVPKRVIEKVEAIKINAADFMKKGAASSPKEQLELALFDNLFEVTLMNDNYEDVCHYNEEKLEIIKEDNSLDLEDS